MVVIEQTIIEGLKVAGGAAAIFLLFWRILDEFGSYLRIYLKVDVSANSITALTTVENKGYRSKNLYYAFLLISPEDESPVDTANAILGTNGYNYHPANTNGFEFFRQLNIFTPLYDNDRALIPLNYYYFENVRISDETLTYRALIDRAHLQNGKPYSIRFYIFGKHIFRLSRLHRSVHDCFVFM